jgi:hypothetical protein
VTLHRQLSWKIWIPLATWTGQPALAKNLALARNQLLGGPNPACGKIRQLLPYRSRLAATRNLFRRFLWKNETHRANPRSLSSPLANQSVCEKVPLDAMQVVATPLD